MNIKQKPIGIFGGTFDPVHFGHLRIALELKQLLDLQEVRLLPCKDPVHKQKTSFNAKQRCEMLELAVKNEPSLSVDTREIDRNTPSYMVETLTSFRQEFSDTPLCLIMGVDAFVKMDTWKCWQELADLAHIIVVQRPGYEIKLSDDQYNFFKSKMINHTQVKKLSHELAGYILVEQVRLLNISATEIRKLLKNHESPRYLLPDAVLNYLMP